MTDDLKKLLGVEAPLDDINRALRRYARSFDAPVVGALQVTCADEDEWECADSFQRHFVNDLLPSFKFGHRAALRLANLGARYEWGALSIAEHHFATLATHDAFKVLLVKLNAHVAAEGTDDGAQYGGMQRYDTGSTACGALHTLLAQSQAVAQGAARGDRPFLADLRSAFQAEGQDRLMTLLDKKKVAPAVRMLLAAIVNAQLQAHRVMAEIEKHKPHSPTLYVVASAVTLNRSDRDTELLCGLWTHDQRSDAKTRTYVGLGDDPAGYKVTYDLGRLHVNDDQLPA